jgi:hexokinase
MNIQDKTKKELISELKESQKENNLLKTLCDEISSLKKKKWI